MDNALAKKILLQSGFWPMNEGYWSNSKPEYKGIKASITDDDLIRYELDLTSVKDNVEYSFPYTRYISPLDAFSKGGLPTILDIVNDEF